MNKVRKTSMGISSLLINDELSFDSVVIVDHVINYYTELFTISDSSTFDANILESFIHPVMTSEDNNMIMVVPSADEIKALVFGMDSSSSPGPDGFGGNFYQYFFETLHILAGLNSIFVMLIPKKTGANIVEDFRPIFSFNPGKRIHSCIALASDAINILDNPRKVGNMALKFDMHKAFDTDSWWFLLTMLQKLSFSSFISDCCWLGFVKGIPYPLMFCIIEKALGRWIDWEISLDRLPQISRVPMYLLYADDILVFAKASTANIHHLHSILSSYGELSGQLYNPSKSKVYFGTAVNNRIKNYITRITSITFGVLLFTYLGVPLFQGAPRWDHLSVLVNSITCKFGKWKGHSLSLAGRI
ncbi:hypothetical protein ACS0TY_021767 [Phlomoides rotata]